MVLPVVDMLFSDDVIDVEDKIRNCAFAQVTILATPARSLSN
jgi:hypothetical protein